MKVLIACEFSGVVRDAFINKGHEAISCDLLPTESPGPHIQDDVSKYLDDDWDLMIAHPPCTYITNAGVRHLHSTPSRTGKIADVHGEERWRFMYDACTFFNLLKNCGIPKIAVENPVPHGYARKEIGWYDQIIQPWQFGHGETKKTCLWLKNLSKLIPTNIVNGRKPACHWTSPSVLRWKIRSVTYKGIAEAMAEQWG